VAHTIKKLEIRSMREPLRTGGRGPKVVGIEVPTRKGQRPSGPLALRDLVQRHDRPEPSRAKFFTWPGPRTDAGIE
jgi:hypothetical protein